MVKKDYVSLIRRDFRDERRGGSHKRLATPVFLLTLLFLFFILCMPIEQVNASTYSPTNNWNGYRPMTAVFPGMSPGRVWLTRSGMEMAFDYAGAEVAVSLAGRALLLPVKAGSGNQGTLNILFDSSMSAFTAGNDKMRLLWRRQVPPKGKRVLVGEAVLALTRQPRYGEKLERWNPAIPAASTTVSGITTSSAALSLPVGHIVRVPVWALNTGDNTLSFSLGTAPSPVPGKRISPVPAETLRYVSSDVLLPQSYKPVLNWTGNLPCLKQGETFQFNPVVIGSLRAMLLEAYRQGVTGFDLDNSYRSALWQKQLFDRRLALSKSDATVRDPLATTLRRVARPFGSEHQTGLAFDMYAKTGYGTNFGNTLNYRWINEQGWEFGFVIRYPENGEPVTNVMYEAWHIRYVGKPMAGYLAREQIPYEGFAVNALTRGAVWLGDVEVDSGTVWLAILATPDASYASGKDNRIPEISEFLPGRRIWLIPMGRFTQVVPSY